MYKLHEIIVAKNLVYAFPLPIHLLNYIRKLCIFFNTFISYMSSTHLIKLNIHGIIVVSFAFIFLVRANQIFQIVTLNLLILFKKTPPFFLLSMTRAVLKRICALVVRDIVRQRSPSVSMK